jgi:hypothetical protein
MERNFAGGCVCGEISYECRAEPIEEYYCHCTNCQKMTGSAYGAFFLVRQDRVKLTGKLTRYTLPTEYGDTVQLFCPSCGTCIGGESASEPSTISLSAGTLEDPSSFNPSTHYWVRSKQPWDLICDDLKQEATQ